MTAVKRIAGDRAQTIRRAPAAVVMGAAVVAGLLAACSRSSPPAAPAMRADRPDKPAYDSRLGTSASPRLISDGRAIPKGGGTYKVGVPYQVAGRWYYPKEEPGYDRRGIASWYGDDFHGRKTANGEVYDMNGLSAAHTTLPLPSYVWVTNEANGRTLLVRVNDRGPYAHDRVIDLSRAVARALGSEGRGLANVRVRFAGPAPLNGDDRREQAYLRNQPWYNGQDMLAQRRAPYARPVAATAEAPRWLPTAARTPAPAMPLPPASGPRRFVVAGIFRSEANAQRRADEVRRIAQAEIRPVTTAAGTTYRVRILIADDASGQRLRARLAETGITDTAIASE